MAAHLNSAANMTRMPVPASFAGKLRLWAKRLGWLLLIWTLSVAALGVAAGLMRLFMHALGMR